MDRNNSTDERRYVSNQDESCRMFRTAWLERCSHVAPWIPHVIFVPVIVVAAWIGLTRLDAGSFVLYMLAGMVLWSLAEYTIHRFVFHPPDWIEEDTRRITGGLAPGEPVMPALPTLRHRFYFLVHGVHHDYPNDSTRLVMPPSVSIPLAVMFFWCFHVVVGSRAPAVFAGFVTGYLTYDTIHYLTHLGSMRSLLGRTLRKRHYRHHYADSSKNFGVSSPLWDYVMGTAGRGDRGGNV
jgi:4-hydroxysphinganine ceramide fatty acyl 2-hydroxylase